MEISANIFCLQQSEVRLPLETGIVGHVVSTGQLININNVYNHPLFYAGCDRETGFKTRNILCFPISDNNEVIGVAELCNKQSGSHFTKFDEEMAMAFRYTVDKYSTKIKIGLAGCRN